MKQSSAWISQRVGAGWGQGGPIHLTDDGWIESLEPGQYAETLVFREIEGRYPGGDFVCLYNGRGLIDFRFDGKVITRTPGRIVVHVTPSPAGVSLQVRQSNPADPVRNIRLLPAVHEHDGGAQLFRPAFLKRWSAFDVLRFMDWQRTNDSSQAEWKDRTTPVSQSQTSENGVALEYMLELANRLEADPWFSIPHLATDDYVREFAELVHKRLHSGRRVYIEYSNELWNGVFSQSQYCRDQGQAEKLGADVYLAGLRFQSQRSVEIFEIWQEVFSGQQHRLVRVLAAQCANVQASRTVLTWREAFRHADALAVAPYFGHRYGAPQNVEETLRCSDVELIKRCESDVATTLSQVASQAILANQHGLVLLAYEGGQHLAGQQGTENRAELTSLFQAANRHPQMKRLYQMLLDGWRRRGGGPFCLYASLGRYSKWGSWGLGEFYDQPPDEMPKYQAALEYLAH